jgi:hypothetical protein
MDLRAWLFLAHVPLFACDDTTEPTVTDVSPARGPYGTIVTIEGVGLDTPTKNIVFENGVSISLAGNPASFLAWDDTKIVFRMPSPGTGDYRIHSPDFSLDLGRFEPTPWRPIALSTDAELATHLDWVALDPDTVVEAVRVGQSLELRFFGPQGVEAIQTVGVDALDAELVAIAADTVNGFFFGRRTNVVFGAFTATRTTIDVVMGTPPSTAAALVAADRDAQGSYAWLSDLENGRLLKWRVTEGVLHEASSVNDPDDPLSVERILAVRDQMTWRVWAINEQSFDDEVELHAAYLAPGAGEFAAPIALGGVDDKFLSVRAHGVGLNGELAVDFCGNEDDPLGFDGTYCASVTADPDGVFDSSEAEVTEPRDLHYVFDDGVAPLACADHVNFLAMPRTSDASEPMFAPCSMVTPLHKLDARGAPSFGLDGTVLTKYE